MKLYFYRLTKEPKDRIYYNYHKGIAGFKNPTKHGNKLLLHGTMQDLEKFLTNYKPARKPQRDYVF